MAYPNVFEGSTTKLITHRLDKLSNETVPEWGKMNAAQMLAHLNIAYDIAYGKIPMQYNWFMKTMFKMFLKPMVCSDKKPYPKNGQTAPVFKIETDKDFEAEKAKFLENVKMTASKGATYFEGKESASFGKLSAEEWNTQFYKHLDHHFTQFGV